MAWVVTAIIVSAIGTGVSMYQAQESAEDAAYAAQQQADAESKYLQELADAKIAALYETAGTESANIDQAAADLKKQQVAAAAKAGVDVTSGTPIDLQSETDKLAGEDKATIMSEAKSQADLWRLDASGQSSLLQLEADATAESAQNSADAYSTGALFDLASTTVSAGKDYLKSGAGSDSLLTSTDSASSSNVIKQEGDYGLDMGSGSWYSLR